MEKVLTAEEMFEANTILPEGVERQSCIAFMKVFAKMHVKAALKAASELEETSGTEGYKIYPESILDAYPLDLIK